MKEFIDKTTEQNGTPINRENLMALQGFDEVDVDIEENIDGSIAIVEKNGKGETLTVNAITNEDGSIVIAENFVGEKTIKKITTINADSTKIMGVLK